MSKNGVCLGNIKSGFFEWQQGIRDEIKVWVSIQAHLFSATVQVGLYGGGEIHNCFSFVGGGTGQKSQVKHFLNIWHTKPKRFISTVWYINEQPALSVSISKHTKQKQNNKAWLIYLKLDLVTLAFSVFMERAFHCAVLAISSVMFTTEGSMLGNKHTLISSTCLAIPLIRWHTLIILSLGYVFCLGTRKYCIILL